MASVLASVLATLPLAQVASIYNAGLLTLPVDGFSVVKKFASKDAGIARIEKYLAAAEGRVDLQVESVDGVHHFAWVEIEGEARPDPESHAEEAAEAEAPFVKLSKAELDALGERGSPAREAYRKARRAAARQARKAKAE